MIPLWDDIEIPPGYTLRDINDLSDEPRVDSDGNPIPSLRVEMQGRALELWVEEEVGSWEAFTVREWSDDEGMFAVYDATDTIVGIQILVEVEDA